MARALLMETMFYVAVPNVSKRCIHEYFKQVLLHGPYGCGHSREPTRTQIVQSSY
jgi:hypothetical protein